jgi:hypothetical protein
MVCTPSAAQFVIAGAHFVGVERCVEMERFAACDIGALTARDDSCSVACAIS